MTQLKDTDTQLGKQANLIKLEKLGRFSLERQQAFEWPCQYVINHYPKKTITRKLKIILHPCSVKERFGRLNHPPIFPSTLPFSISTLLPSFLLRPTFYLSSLFLYYSLFSICYVFFISFCFCFSVSVGSKPPKLQDKSGNRVGIFSGSLRLRKIAVGQVKVRCWCGSIKSELVVIGCFDLIEPCQYHIDRCADAVDIRQLSIKGVCEWCNRSKWLVFISFCWVSFTSPLFWLIIVLMNACMYVNLVCLNSGPYADKSGPCDFGMKQNQQFGCTESCESIWQVWRIYIWLWLTLAALLPPYWKILADQLWGSICGSPSPKVRSILSSNRHKLMFFGKYDYGHKLILNIYKLLFSFTFNGFFFFFFQIYGATYSLPALIYNLWNKR